jgi:hypothetical protein
MPTSHLTQAIRDRRAIFGRFGLSACISMAHFQPPRMRANETSRAMVMMTAEVGLGLFFPRRRACFRRRYSEEVQLSQPIFRSVSVGGNLSMSSRLIRGVTMRRLACSPGASRSIRSQPNLRTRFKVGGIRIGPFALADVGVGERHTVVAGSHNPSRTLSGRHALVRTRVATWCFADVRSVG